MPAASSLIIAFFRSCCCRRFMPERAENPHVAPRSELRGYGDRIDVERERAGDVGHRLRRKHRGDRLEVLVAASPLPFGRGLG